METVYAKWWGPVFIYGLRSGGGEEDWRRILGGSHGFQGKRRGGSVIANRVELDDYRKLAAN